MIKISNLTHMYGTNKALNNVDLEINRGEIFGLIGHNGAGKSTAIKALVSILEPTSGDIFIDGKDLKTQRLEIKRQIGYVADSPDMFLEMQAIEYWRFIGDIFGMDPAIREQRIDELCKIFDMAENKWKLIKSFSHGMRQKTFVIGALLSKPDVWILDEPMTGLDPQSSFNLKELMRDHAKSDKTVLFSTHVLEVAEKLCDRIGILKKGELIFVGTVEELKASNSEKSLEEIYLEMADDGGQGMNSARKSIDAYEHEETSDQK